MSCRSEFGNDKPLKGARIAGSLHVTIQTAVLVETLKDLGADLRWVSCNIYSTQDHAAAALVKADSAKVFAWKGESLEEYWECTFQLLNWGDDHAGPNMIVDDGGDFTLLIHLGHKHELEYEKSGKLPDPSTAGHKEEAVILKMLADFIPKNPKKFQNVIKDLIGSSEETTTGVQRVAKMARDKELLFPVININDSVTKSKFDNVYGCKHSLPDGLMRATDIMIAGKKVVICGFGDVGKGCAAAMKGCGARVYITEIDPICALQAAMEGYHVCKIESALKDADIYITATGNLNIITVKHMSEMKNNAIIGNIGHFDTEIDMDGVENFPGIVRTEIKPQVDSFKFPDGHAVIILASGRLLNLGCATGHPSFVMSNSFTNQVMAQMELWTNKETGKYKDKEVFVLPKALDEKVARLHLAHLGAELTELSTEQSKYIGIPVAGPYKKDEYRY